MVAETRKEWQLLIADDDAGFRETLRLIFDPWFHLFEAESGEEALDIVAANQVHLALLDMHMHLLTGLETLRTLQAMELQIPCILISADADDALKAEATSADAFDVLRKPVQKRELCDTVSTAMREAYDIPFPLN